MDEQTYIELREELRKQADKEAARARTVAQWAASLAASMNKDAGRTQNVCLQGRIDQDGNFLSGSVAGSGAHYCFALKVLFHDFESKVIFQPVIVINVDFAATHATFSVDGNDRNVEMLNSELHNLEKKNAVLSLVDDRIKEKVLAALAKGSIS